MKKLSESSEAAGKTISEIITMDYNQFCFIFTDHTFIIIRSYDYSSEVEIDPHEMDSMTEYELGQFKGTILEDEAKEFADNLFKEKRRKEKENDMQRIKELETELNKLKEKYFMVGE